MKTCKKCGQAKPVSEFLKHPGFPDGLRSDCKKCYHLHCAQYRKENRVRILDAHKKDYQKSGRERMRQKLYGLKPGEYESIFTAQCGVCAICQQPSKRSLDVDHDHKTGRVRGLLCSPCNRGVGLLKDSVDILHKAAEYITKYEN